MGRNYRKGTGALRLSDDYETGEVVCLHWDGSDLAINWTSASYHDYVADYLLADLDGDTRSELYVLSRATSGFWGTSNATISMYAQTAGAGSP